MYYNGSLLKLEGQYVNDLRNGEFKEYGMVVTNEMIHCTYI